MEREEILETLRKLLNENIVQANDNAYNYLNDALDELTPDN